MKQLYTRFKKLTKVSTAGIVEITGYTRQSIHLVVNHNQYGKSRKDTILAMEVVIDSKIESLENEIEQLRLLMREIADIKTKPKERSKHE
jgi:hypothetical protein